jgi:hypothetical protein
VICLDVADLAARAAGETAQAESMRRKVSNTVRELESVQPNKIALNQKSDARGGRTRRETPVQRCAVLLDTAPPGHAAWALPIEPFLLNPFAHRHLRQHSRNWPIAPLTSDNSLSVSQRF